ncbi:hypothetical protein [Actinomadura violacea]|uniref:Uncharacterized protein n=1 Tax=Actinomadura violacea TaxID=2819934 RepID=A0ABS3RY42_9ACTN|nr:hypothetical protein [Actinomadura violacea]MBO2461675.1 hypothetical protein [Actinomadura violacea]
MPNTTKPQAGRRGKDRDTTAIVAVFAALLAVLAMITFCAYAAIGVFHAV